MLLFWAPTSPVGVRRSIEAADAAQRPQRHTQRKMAKKIAFCHVTQLPALTVRSLPATYAIARLTSACQRLNATSSYSNAALPSAILRIQTARPPTGNGGGSACQHIIGQGGTALRQQPHLRAGRLRDLHHVHRVPRREGGGEIDRANIPSPPPPTHRGSKARRRMRVHTYSQTQSVVHQDVVRTTH